MRPFGTKTKVALMLLVLVSAYAAYHLFRGFQGQRHYQAVQEALERRDFGQADLHLQKCLALRPRDPALRLLAARTARRRGHFAEAHRQLRLHEEYQGSAPERQRERQLLLVQQGELADVEALLQDCSRDPPLPDADLLLEAVLDGLVSSLESSYQTGLSLVEGPSGRDRARAETAAALWRARRLGWADQVQGRIWLGRIHLLLDPQEAVKLLREAVKLDPDHFNARLYLAVALAEYEPRESLRHLAILHQRDPGNSQIGYLLATFHHSLGQLREAGAILDALLVTHPEHVAALLERGKVALEAGHAEEAEPFLRRALDLTPNDPFLHLLLSRCLHLLGKFEEAKRHQQYYNHLETARTSAKRARAEEDRAAWRSQLAREALHKSGSGDQP